MAISAEPWRFFDGAQPPPGQDGSGASDARYSLDRVVVDDHGIAREEFCLLRQIGYLDRPPRKGTGGAYRVPAPGVDFTTDLTSVPALFTWLVPKTGAHLPAALVHDGLIAAPGAPQHEGPPVDAVTADRIFRDAMADAGTGVLRRWIVWTAVTLRTIFAGDTSERAVCRHYYRAVAAATLGSIAWLGYQATAEIVGRTDRWPLTYHLFWVDGDGFWRRFVTGAIGAIVIPLVFGLAWLRFWRAGMIAGVALGALLHVTAALIAISAVYLVVETLVTDGPQGLAARVAWLRRKGAWWLVGAAVAAAIGLAAAIAVVVAAIAN